MTPAVMLSGKGNGIIFAVYFKNGRSLIFFLRIESLCIDIIVVSKQ